MTYTIMAYLTRKPTLSPAQFQTYYEETHIPLLLSLTSSVFPLSHTRHYLTRTAEDPTSSDITNANHVLTIFEGKPEDFYYDVYAELVFESVEKWGLFAQRLGEISADPEGVFRKDEEAFLDLKGRRCVVVDEAVVTVKPQ